MTKEKGRQKFCWRKDPFFPKKLYFFQEKLDFPPKCKPIA